MLPESPNLEHLKKQAKSLLASAKAGDAAAVSRFAALPAYRAIGQSAHQAIDAGELALHDAQSVIAREHGFASWNALREEVETRTLSFADAVDAFVRAGSDGARDRARRLLTLYPAIATATLQTELLLADVAGVEKRLRERGDLATAPGGPQQWEPLLYVCHSCLAHRGRGEGGLHRDDPQRLDGYVAIAKRLLALGANPNAQYHWNWHPELPRTALWAALITMSHVPLATALLDAGANPTDGVTPQIAAGSGNIAALELLLTFGLNVNGTPGGVPPLVYMMQWSEDASGARWLLEHGADPNLPWGPDHEAPLHVAARRWDLALVQLLVAKGANPRMRRADGYTAHTLAELHGNHDIAEWLLAHGAIDEMSPLDRFIAAAARGDGGAADALLRDHPGLAAQLTTAHHLMLQRPAEAGNAAALETMLTRGFNPNIGDKDGVTALHRAAMAGHRDAVATLIRFGARMDALDGMFAATPLLWAVEGRNHAQPGSDHVAVARVLIDAGSPLDWTPPLAAPAPEKTLDALRELRRDAAAAAAR